MESPDSRYASSNEAPPKQQQQQQQSSPRNSHDDAGDVGGGMRSVFLSLSDLLLLRIYSLSCF